MPVEEEMDFIHVRLLCTTLLGAEFYFVRFVDKMADIKLYCYLMLMALRFS